MNSVGTMTTQLPETLLKVDNVSKTFDLPNGGEVCALSDLSLTVGQGEFVSIVGPSGCGKSTLFNIIGGLTKQDQGTITLTPNESGETPKIGMVFQQDSSFPWRTVQENIEFPLEMMGMDRQQRKEKVQYFVELVGLQDFTDSFPNC